MNYYYDKYQLGLRQESVFFKSDRVCHVCFMFGYRTYFGKYENKRPSAIIHDKKILLCQLDASFPKCILIFLYLNALMILCNDQCMKSNK